MRFGKCMGTLGGHWGRICEFWEMYGDPRGHRRCLYKVHEVYRHPRGHIVSIVWLLYC